MFSSGKEGSDPKMAQIWKLLDESGVDIVVVGHAHDHERFARQDYAGGADRNSIREFVVGTGGRNLQPFSNVEPNSEVRDDHTRGVLKLTLHTTSYDWDFVPEPGATFRDSGSGECAGPGTKHAPNAAPY